jgi:hypothetical protein
VVSVATAGDLLQWHPHLHLITTDAGRARDGSWHALPQWDAVRLMRLFRERLLTKLVERRAISKELVAKVVAWRHPGFSAHVGERIAAEDKQRLEDTATYLVRNPLSLKKLVYLDGQQAVLYRSKLNPFLGRNFEAMDPVEWLARMSDHIPDPGQHRTLFYGEYANRVRSEPEPAEADTSPVPAQPPRKRCSPSWARLIAKVYQVDPLLCVRCGQGMSIVAFVIKPAAFAHEQLFVTVLTSGIPAWRGPLRYLNVVAYYLRPARRSPRIHVSVRESGNLNVRSKKVTPLEACMPQELTASEIESASRSLITERASNSHSRR